MGWCLTCFSNKGCSAISKWNLFKARLLVSVLLCLLSFTSVRAEKAVTLWSYYRFPPFVTGEQKGLSYDFVRLLNRYSEGLYQFNLQLLPRKRLDKLLSEGAQGTVLFVHWSWMGDKEQSRYLWTPAFLLDRNEIIYHRNNPVFYDGSADSLKGLTLGGVLGRRYKGIDPLVDNGEITRVDVSGEDQNIYKLLHQRIDVTTMPASMFFYLRQQLDSERELLSAQKPMSEYSRHILVSKELHEVHAFLSIFNQWVAADLRWQQTLIRYGLQEQLESLKVPVAPE